MTGLTREEAKKILEGISYKVGGFEDFNNMLLAIDTLNDYTDILDKIKEDIKEWYNNIDKQELIKNPCIIDSMVDLFIKIIDKYRRKD